jgi:hypothetical protein
MPDRSSKRPTDPNQLAKLIADIATGEAEEAIHPQFPTRIKDPAAVALGRKGGLKGGMARASKLSSEERKTIATRAAQARWQKKSEEQ